MGAQARQARTSSTGCCAAPPTPSFAVQLGDLSMLPSVRYVITLDSDTQLPLEARPPPGRHAGASAEPAALRCPAAAGHRRLRRAAAARRGQPRQRQPDARSRRSFSGHVGLDPYTTAVSDVYQDLFHEGSYVGKGIYDVDAFDAALAGRVPENTLLSHDLFEGFYARAGLCTDIHLVDDYPTHYLAFAARQHRWVRGDWQIVALAVAHGARRRRPARAEHAAGDRALEDPRQPAPQPACRRRWSRCSSRAGRCFPGRRGCGRARRCWCWRFRRTSSSADRSVEPHPRRAAPRAPAGRSDEHARQRGARRCLSTVFLLASERADARCHRPDARADARDAPAACSSGSTADARRSHAHRRWPVVSRRMWQAPAIGASAMAIAGRWLFAPGGCRWRCRSWCSGSLSPVVGVRDRSAASAHGRRRCSRRDARGLPADGPADVALLRGAGRTADHWLIPDNYPGRSARADRAPHLADQHRAAAAVDARGLRLRLPERRRRCSIGSSRRSRRCSACRAIAGISTTGTTRGRSRRWRRPTSRRSTAATSPGTCSRCAQASRAVERRPIIDAAFSRAGGRRSTSGRRRDRAATIEAVRRRGRSCSRPRVQLRAASAHARRVARRRAWRASADAARTGARSACCCTSSKSSPRSATDTARRLARARRGYWLERAAATVAGAPASSTRLTALDAQSRRAAAALRRPCRAWSELAAACVRALECALAAGSTADARPRDRRSARRMPASCIERAERLGALADDLVEETDSSSCSTPSASSSRSASTSPTGASTARYYDTARLRGAARQLRRDRHGQGPARALVQARALADPEPASARALLSWSASMFEYLMPLLVMRVYPGTLLDETYDGGGRAPDRSTARSAACRGASRESAYYAQDLEGNYQYRAFGVPGPRAQARAGRRSGRSRRTPRSWPRRSRPRDVVGQPRAAARARA